jgi:tryptophan synthase alpha chain
VTGAREDLPHELESAVRRVKEYGKRPVAVGFGVSTPAQVKRIGSFADGVIVGSAIVKIIEENIKDSKMISRVGDFVGSLANALE